MGNQQCKTCGYFVQHYVLGKDKLLEAHCGHCIYACTKRKCPDAEACGNYLAKQPAEDIFVSKEYLSKALLQKVLDMELLPKIEAEDEGFDCQFAEGKL